MKPRPPFLVLIACLAVAAFAAPPRAAASDDPAVPSAETAPAHVDCVFADPDDSAVGTAGPDGVVLRVASATGIGRARLTFAEGDGPSRLTLRLERLGNMEDFTATDGNVELHGRLGSAVHFDRNGRETRAKTDGGYSLTIRRPEETRRGIEVELTAPRSASGTRPWRLAWINAFRR
jgi:hypothetical protein